MQRFSSALVLLAVLLGPVACDLSPTDARSLDPAGIDNLIRAAGRRGSDPAQRAILELLARAKDEGGGPLLLPQLDSLFGLAMLTQSARQPDRSVRDRQTHDALLTQAWAAIEAGDNGTGERLLADARRFQAESAVRIVGPVLPLVYQSLLDASVERSLALLEPGGTFAGDRARLLRMAGTIRDIGIDARHSLASGDAAEALDLASHAAGLANSLQSHLKQ